MRIVYTLFFTLLIGGISLGVYHTAFQRLESAAQATSKERLSLYQATLRSTLARVAHLPRVVVLHPFTGEVLRQGKSVASFNDYLKDALVPALHKMGLDRIGVFNRQDKPDDHYQ